MQVGFIGLGAMGLPMTRHLIEAGHDVTVASRSRGPIDEAVALGAHEADGPLAVVEASEITLLCVPNSPDVVAVLDAAMPALGAGKLIVDTSTIDPEVERAQHDRVNAAGARYLEAPLSGGTAGAQAGTLTLMVGGDADTLDAARPALDPFAGLIVHVGGPGHGPGRQALQQPHLRGTDARDLRGDRDGREGRRRPRQALRGAHALERRLRRRAHALPSPGVVPDSPASNNWAPGFMTDLMAKDLDLAITYAGKANTPLFTSGIVRQMLGAASAAGYGREDFSALAKVVRALAGT